MIPTYRIQMDRPHLSGATATVFFPNASGDIAFPGIVVSVSPGMTLEQIAQAADDLRSAPQEVPGA